MVGLREPWEVPGSAGVLPAVAENIIAIPVNDEEALEQAGVNPKRIRLQWASASEAQIFADGVKTLIEQVRELGPIRSEWK